MCQSRIWVSFPAHVITIKMLIDYELGLATTEGLEKIYAYVIASIIDWLKPARAAIM